MDGHEPETGPMSPSRPITRRRASSEAPAFNLKLAAYADPAGGRPDAYRSIMVVEACSALLDAVSSGAPFEEAARAAARWAQMLSGAEGASVTRIVGDDLVYVAASGRVADVEGRRLPKDKSFTGGVIAAGVPCIFDPSQAPAQSRLRAELDDVRSGIVVPLVVHGVPIGSLGVTSSRPQVFRDNDVAVVRSLGVFLVLILERVPNATAPPEVATLAAIELRLAYAETELLPALGPEADPLREALADVRDLLSTLR